MKACECLGIRVIHDNTADMETVHVKSIEPDMTENSLKQYLQMAVLILAGIESAPDWEPAYSAYFEEISKMKFVCCESIILRYKMTIAFLPTPRDSTISQVLIHLCMLIVTKTHDCLQTL